MERRFLLLLPFIAVFIDFDEPVSEYLIYWFASLFIIIFTTFIENDRAVTGGDKAAHFFRPIYLPHIVFTLYMSLSTIFYFLDAYGFYFFEYDPARADIVRLEKLAYAQKLYLIAHLAFVGGMYATMNYDFVPSYKFDDTNYPNKLLRLTLVFFGLSVVTKVLPGLSQLSLAFEGVSYVSSIMLIIVAFQERKTLLILYSCGIFISNYIVALTSGSKEAIIVHLLFLNVFLMQKYKAVSFILSIPAAIFIFYYVPTFSGIIRSLKETENLTNIEQITYAFKEIESGNVDVEENNWAFLVNRFSEVGMFVKYIDAVPQYTPYYNWKIFNQGIEALVPRIFNPDKPILEHIVMERVRDLGIIEDYSQVSAKPVFIVDCYLSGGVLIIIIGNFILGLLLSLISSKSEDLFGGYLIGTSLIMTGLYKTAWKPNCFEFFFNNMLWNYFVMYLVFYVLRAQGLLIVNEPEPKMVSSKLSAQNTKNASNT